MIIIYHVSQRITTKATFKFKYGYIGVEFFFIVSGYLLAKQTLNHKKVEDKELGSETSKYIWKKVKSLFPYIFATYILCLPILTIIATIIDSPATILNVVGDSASAMITNRIVDGKNFIKEKSNN